MTTSVRKFISTIVVMGLLSFLSGCSKSSNPSKASKDSFPDDENGEVLRSMQESGDDLSKPRDIDFSFIFSEEQKAKEFAQEVQSDASLRAEASPYEERKMWQATVTKNMVPTHAGITDLETKLTAAAKSRGGEADGWGCMQVDKK